MNFTSDIKKEIITRRAKQGQSLEEKKASICAFIRTSGTIGVRDGVPTFFLVSETENVAEYYMSAFSSVFKTELSVTRATWDRMSGRDKLLLQCPALKSETVLQQLRLIKKDGGIRDGISKTLTATDASKIAYVRGAFLGGGSCTIPSENGKSGYHLEIVFSDKKTALDFCSLLWEFDILAKQTKRKDSFVVYVKSKEQISDFLSLVDAGNALKKLSETVEKRDEANRKNRTQNCISGNADKTAIAAVKQVVALKILKESAYYSELSEELKALSDIRLKHPSKSLQELADELKISKSCLNHRMRRLMELAQKAKELQEEK